MLHIIVTLLDWLCNPFLRHRRGIWEDSGVIWVDPPLDPSFRVVGVRHIDGVDSAHSQRFDEAVQRGPQPNMNGNRYPPLPTAILALTGSPPHSESPSPKEEETSLVAEWVCPPLDPSFKVYGVRHIGEEVVHRSEKLLDSDSDEEDGGVMGTALAASWERVSAAGGALRSRGGRPRGPRGVGERWGPLVAS